MPVWCLNFTPKYTRTDTNERIQTNGYKIYRHQDFLHALGYNFQTQAFYTRSGIKSNFTDNLYPIRYNMKTFPKDHISSFLKYKRSILGLKQEELAKKAGVGIRFLRELEQGKESLKMDKVNSVLRFFGYCTSPVPEKTLSPYSILLKGMQKKIKIYLGKNRLISGTLIGFQSKNGQVLRWKIVADEHLKRIRKNKSSQPRSIC